MIEQLREKIINYNEAYRLGNPLIPDFEYDRLIEELESLSPDDELLTVVGHVIMDETRKSPLPIEMASMNKIKSMEALWDWCRLKGIPRSEYVILTPKLDGLSLCVDEVSDDSWTRGDGVFGQKSNDHYKLIQNKLYSNFTENFDPFAPIPFSYTYGEVMMSRKVFTDKYSNFANPRNLVSGLLNSKEATDPLKDCHYIKYGGVFKDGTFTNKHQVIDELNSGQEVKINYHLCKIDDLTEEMLIDLFHKWGVDFEIDGIIIELDSIELQNKLGRETSSNNPVWARAFKHPSFEQRSEATVLGISWNISKQGLLKPIIHITPIKLDGVTVSNVTGNNARFIKNMGIGVGSRVVVKRSGMVIPLIVEVLERVEFELPVIEGVEIGWNDNEIELITLTETDDQKLKKIISFFEILDADNLGEGVVTQLWDAGYKTIKDILNLGKSDLEKIDRFGKRKAEIVFNSIKKSTSGVQLSKLQHATGIFKGLGSLKLVKLEHFKTKPSVSDVMMIDGFAESSSKSYVDGYDEFFDFIKDLPISIIEKVESVKISNDLEGFSFIFTGVRRPDLVKIIESRGGKECSSVSKNTTHLVCVDKSSSSSKMKKAIDLGIKILDTKDLENLLS